MELKLPKQSSGLASRCQLLADIASIGKNSAQLSVLFTAKCEGLIYQQKRDMMRSFSQENRMRGDHYVDQTLVHPAANRAGKWIGKPDVLGYVFHLLAG